MNGETSRRIREALHRLAHLRIEMHVSQAAQDIGVALLRESDGVGLATSGGSTSSGDITDRGSLRPEEPDGAPVPRPRKGVDTIGVLHVLEYAVTRTYDRREDGEDWIAHLQINPIWLRELAGGWAAWVDVERYVALRSPIAKRLYQLFAGEAARGVPAPWTFGLSDLQERCGTVGMARRPAAVRASVEEAAAELVSQEILAEVHSEKVSRGRYAFAFSPGVQLRMAGLLRGVGALDSRELRVQRMLLRYFGVTRDAADQMLAERPSRVHDALQYLLYVRDTDHTRVKRSWSAYLLKLVESGMNLAGDVKYQHWLARRRQASIDVSDAPRSSGPAAASVGTITSSQVVTARGVRGELALVSSASRVPLMDAARTIAINPDATIVWARIRTRAASHYPPTHAAYVEDLAAFDLTDGTLTCVTASAFTLQMLENAGVADIESELRRATDGQVSVIRLEVFQPERHVAHG